MIRKFFPFDKNYLLEEAQLAVRDELLQSLLTKVKFQYQQRHNPLGIVDSFSQRIQNYQPGTLTTLNGFYESLAGVYRFKFGDNQLELLWDGESHFEKYKRDWSRAFEELTSLFCDREQFIQAVLDLTVFCPENKLAQLAENRMNFVMLKYFEVKIHRQRGIISERTASA